MPDVMNPNTLNCVYFGLLIIGVGYAVFILITGGLSDIDVPNVDIDVPNIDLPGDVDIPGAGVHIGGPDLPAGGLDAPDVSVSPLSPITIASFVTSFGGIGLIASDLFHIGPPWSLLWATGGAFIVSAAMFLFYGRVLVRLQASSEVHSADLVGLPAEVTIAIGEDTAGQVTYSTKSGRMLSTAKSVGSVSIARGQLVQIVRVTGPIVLVKPMSSDADDKSL